jgi:CBS domain-containing protein
MTACAVGDVMAEVKVRTSPGDDLRSLAVALTGARTGLGIVEVEGGGVITERDVLRAIADGTDLDAARVGDWSELVGVLNMRDVVGVLSGAAELGAVPPARGS